jgi:hypothetical protein
MVGLRVSIGVLLAGSVFSALPLLAGDKPRWHSEGWYEERASDPPGARQHYKHGKMWPPFPRPQGKGLTFWHKYHYAHYWPYPYNCQDRDYVHGIFQQQANNGWEFATTLHDYHFDPETNRLNSAGELHLRWILTQAPAQYRTTFISRGTSEPVAQLRLESVQQVAREICGDATPPILLKNDAFLGRPAVEIDTLRRLELQSIPQPRLFIITPSGSGSMSGPSSAQAGGATGQPQSGSNLIK